MTSPGWVVGIDFGGTNIKAGLISPTGRVVSTRLLSSLRFRRPSAFVQGISEMVGSLTAEAGLRPAALCGVGVGAPGPIDPRRGIVHSLVNVPGWREVPLGRQLARRLKCRCLVDNDANLVALGEWRFGAGAQAKHVIALTLGTGVGGGVIINGKLYRGVSGSAGEVGHMVIDPRGRRCSCGARGCLEAQVGTAAILSMARRAIRRGAEPLKTLARQARGQLTPALVSRAAMAGDQAARAVWMEIGRSLGIGVGNVLNLLNPERLVIGGGVANAWALFAPTLIRTVRAQAMPVSAHAARILRARLGHHAGILGAAVLLWDNRH
ncbi:MAG: ROK family protein [Candidatus Omnitrophica bacterium]|nr:ROK family protein [Candidatus Omnitrophota bacterium]